MKSMLRQFHMAAQYLAAAGKSFIDVKSDDSHTNLGWSTKEHALNTWPLSKHEDVLSLSYDSFSLIWTDQFGYKNEFLLDDRNHKQIIEWLSTHAQNKLGKPYHYNLHYELPYPFPTDDYEYHFSSIKEANDISTLLDIGQKSLEQILIQQNLSSSIRVWPHHFDLGCFANSDDTKSVGFGLAIPDSAINDFYYYVSGYHGENSIETKNFKPLQLGVWQIGSWKAATLKASEINKETIIQFLSESINRLLE